MFLSIIDIISFQFPHSTRWLFPAIGRSIYYTVSTIAKLIMMITNIAQNPW